MVLGAARVALLLSRARGGSCAVRGFARSPSVRDGPALSSALSLPLAPVCVFDRSLLPGLYSASRTALLFHSRRCRPSSRSPRSGSESARQLCSAGKLRAATAARQLCSMHAPASLLHACNSARWRQLLGRGCPGDARSDSSARRSAPLPVRQLARKRDTPEVEPHRRAQTASSRRRSSPQLSSS